MIGMHLAEVAALVGGTQAGPDAAFIGVSTDSRAVKPGSLFVAIRGPRFDGHDYVRMALDAGAAGALVSVDGGAGLPCVVVEDSLRALGILARAWRRRFTPSVVAITGSNGKTTVKEMLATILRRQGPVLATRGNLNNEIGLPLSVLELESMHARAVLEMGANHPGEIARLAAIALPHTGVITQCAPAHLEGFGSIEGVARAKGELITSLSADGIAILNADDDYFGLWRELAGERRVLSFGLGADADVRASWQAESQHTDMTIHGPGGCTDVRLALPGAHNVMNALAAATAALALNVPGDTIRLGLEDVRPVPGRLNTRSAPGGGRIIDDTYNANPASLAAGLEVLSGFAGERWLVLGDMAELGPGADEFHREAGEQARLRGIERLFTVGQASREAAQAFGSGAAHFDTQESLLAALGADLPGEVTVLVKGSRSMHMEHVVCVLAGGG